MRKASTYQRRARNFTQRENWDAALAELRQALAADASNPLLHNQMGDLFLRKEEIQEACQHFEKAIDLYSDLGLHANAVALCRKVIRLCPSRLEVRFRLARLRHDQGLHSETTASFVDFLEHVPVRDDAEVRSLEDRCREIVEQFPQAAPIGKILEKLEEARAFACAFEIVQRLAQRAADAGDDDAARRYTTKMRSLRVLVEGCGGDLPGKPTQPDDLPRAVAEATAAERAPKASTAPPRPEATRPPASLQLEDIRGTIAPSVFSAAPAAPASVPELDLEVPEVAAAAPTEEAPDAMDRTAVPAEYELPETSLADIASLFETQPSAPAESAATDDVFEIDVPETAASESAAAVPEWSLETREAPADLVVPPADATPTAAADTSAQRELFTPVWVPDETSGDLAGPQPLAGGSTHELAEVIDTFRRQMALALGDDAAARYDLGVAYFEMGLYDEAMAEFEVARTGAALRERSLEMLAACMAMQGRHAEILDLLAPALQMQADPKLGLGLHFSMGVACEALGRRHEARQHFEAVALVDSSYRDVRTRLLRC